MSDGMGREFTYLSSHATNRYFIPNWGNYDKTHMLTGKVWRKIGGYDKNAIASCGIKNVLWFIRNGVIYFQ